MDSDAELKPCPFCGSKASLYTYTDMLYEMFKPIPGLFYIQCNKCTCCLDSANRRLLIQEWNTRVQSNS